MATIVYSIPPRGACPKARAAWISHAAYAVAPDFIFHSTAPRSEVVGTCSDVLPAAPSVRALASALTTPEATHHQTATASWSHAFALLTSRDPRMRLSLHLAAMGNPFPMALRYNEMQPYVRLDMECPVPRTGRE